VRALVGVDEMRPNVILDDLGHRSARAGDRMRHLFAARLRIERALNRLLASDAAHSRQQLGFFADGVRHGDLSHTPYPIRGQRNSVDRKQLLALVG
jgi:hypothetical protein